MNTNRAVVTTDSIQRLQRSAIWFEYLVVSIEEDVCTGNDVNSPLAYQIAPSVKLFTSCVFVYPCVIKNLVAADILVPMIKQFIFKR